MTVTDTDTWKPPADTDVEADLIGAALRSQGALDVVLGSLEPSDFYRAAFSLVVASMRRLSERGEPVDPHTVNNELRDAGTPLEDPYLLITVTNGIASTANAGAYAGIVKKRARERRRLELARDFFQAETEGRRAVADAVLAEIITLGNETGSASDAVIDGARFAFDAPTRVEPIWGRGAEVLWSPGETLVAAGPQGTLKSHLAQHLALARAGIIDEVLGWQVVPGSRVLYVAADRPAQIQRSFARMVSEVDREALSERLLFTAARFRSTSLGTREHSSGT